jgi:uncharacterized protein YprB with RNaseH-like and TPR domain
LKQFFSKKPCFLDIETTGLSAEKARVTCVGCLTKQGVFVFGDSNESDLLKNFFLWISSVPDSLLVSYNGLSFDLPFLIKRGKLYGLDFGFLNDFGHIDLLPLISKKYGELVSPSSTGRISKDSARRWLNIYEPAGPSAVHCLLAASVSDFFPIFQHNVLDLFTTYFLLVKCLELGWVD